jgi:hypothetical protein
MVGVAQLVRAPDCGNVQVAKTPVFPGFFHSHDTTWTQKTPIAGVVAGVVEVSCSIVASEIGEREFDRLTASKSAQGARVDVDTSRHNGEKLKTPRDQSRLRAINRAPATVKALYDRDLLAVDLAAKFGPKVS